MYQRPYDPRLPQVCIDEASKQLIAETRQPLPAAPGQPERFDHEYERKGVANLFLSCEPLRGWRAVSVTERRTMVDWAHAIQELVDVHYPDAERIVLVMDNVNTHSPGSLYQAFPPAEAKRLAGGRCPDRDHPFAAKKRAAESTRAGSSAIRSDGA